MQDDRVTSLPYKAGVVTPFAEPPPQTQLSSLQVLKTLSVGDLSVDASHSLLAQHVSGVLGSLVALRFCWELKPPPSDSVCGLIVGLGQASWPTLASGVLAAASGNIT